jgi:hypothetical protein
VDDDLVNKQPGLAAGTVMSAEGMNSPGRGAAGIPFYDTDASTLAIISVHAKEIAGLLK